MSRSVDRPHVGFTKGYDEGWERTFGRKGHSKPRSGALIREMMRRDQEGVFGSHPFDALSNAEIVERLKEMGIESPDGCYRAESTPMTERDVFNEAFRRGITKESSFVVGVDEGTPGGDYSCRVTAQKREDGTVVVDEVEYWSPDELAAVTDNPGFAQEYQQHPSPCPYLGAGRDQEHCTRTKTDCPQDDECFHAWRIWLEGKH